MLDLSASEPRSAHSEAECFAAAGPLRAWRCDPRPPVGTMLLAVGGWARPRVDTWAESCATDPCNQAPPAHPVEAGRPMVL